MTTSLLWLLTGFGAPIATDYWLEDFETDTPTTAVLAAALLAGISSVLQR